MEPKNDGGPAYPVSTWNNDTESREVMGGMSLRDRIAISVMQGMLANPNGDWSKTHDGFPVHAYQIADAMLAERERGR